MAVPAARLMLTRISELLRGAESFSFETTCSGRGYVHLLDRARAHGWTVLLIYLGLPSPEKAIERVARRVASGGHSIPAEVIVRRYWAGLRNLHDLYPPLATIAAIYDNSDEGPTLVAERTPDVALHVCDDVRWKAMTGVPR